MKDDWINAGKDWLGPDTEPEKPSKKRPPEPQTVRYSVMNYIMECPRCESRNHRCYSSNPPTRYHVCHDCGCRFKSVEADFKEDVKKN